MNLTFWSCLFQILEDSKPEPDPGCCGQKAEKKKKPVAVPPNSKKPLWETKLKKIISVQKAASAIVTEQPQSIQSVEESKEKINPADSGSVEIQDINPDIDEGHVEEERPEEP